MATTDADMVEFEDATAADLVAVVELLRDDNLGKTRELAASTDLEPYRSAFAEIDADPNHRLIVGRFSERVVSCLQLTFLPCLTHGGTTRAQIEGVRVAASMRGRGVGHVMIWWAIERAKERGCGVVQLTTDKRRADTERFYLTHGFESTHHGMKLDLH